MKPLITLMLLLSIIGCKAKKNAIDQTQKKDGITAHKTINTMHTICPENGICTTKLIKNKSLEVNKDEFGSTYYTQIDNLEKSIIKFSYSRNVPKGLQDTSYREEIIFEIDNNLTTLALTNDDLQKTKMLYGRFCFCRGQTGNYAVTDGNLNLKKLGSKIQFDLAFKNNKVPQLIGFINEIVE